MMTLQELLHKHDFNSIVPHLIAIDDTIVPNNLYAFKEVFDNLSRVTPGEANGNQILVSTEIDIDNSGNEVGRHLHAFGCEGEAWGTCLAKEIIFGTAVGEEKALAQIIWQMACWLFFWGG